VLVHHHTHQSKNQNIMRLVQYTYPTYRSLAPAFAGFARSPWGGLEAQIDQLFAPQAVARFPIELREGAESTVVRAELPGVAKADIALEIADGNLTITVTQKTPGVEGQPETSTEVARSICLNDNVQTDKVTATYENGLLSVTLPKAEAAKPRAIAIS
jgi:HSP20 family protein